MGRLGKLFACEFDLAVVGGGIIGAGIARDAAMRGLWVALVEMGDFGHGTSAASTRLIHGGLRYLEMLDFGLVRQDLQEREILLRIAPHLVRPLPFLIPIYRRGAAYRLKLRIGMVLYDLLSYDRSLPGHRWLSAREALALEPILPADGLEGAFLYYDAQVAFVERLCLENVLSAQEHGACAANYARAEGYLRQDGAIAGLEVADVLTGETARVRARAVVNATGPWLDETLALLPGSRRPLLRRTKGIHLVTPIATRHALVLFAQSDGRLFFVVPWNGLSLVGTTDTDFDGDPDGAAATVEDVHYLVEETRRALPDGPWDEVYATMAGVRALVRVEGVRESAVSRKHTLVDHAERGGPVGLISVAGGKITAYRDIAREAVDRVCRRLGEARPPAPTDREPLPGARFADPAACAQEVTRVGAGIGLDEGQCRALAEIYGSRAMDVLALAAQEPRLARPINAGAPDIMAQVHHAVAAEMALTAEDFLLRRSRLGFSPGQGVESLGAVAAEMAQLLGWDEARRRAEEAAYRARMEKRGYSK
ncbi:MAG: glycerol-3-phosphate dehydrogenase/oxidase [Chloroflexi bacterium]|nr:glycerol-3-phosphate dehydrogenase/oxidase [Chloroflexota bacterium]